MSSDYYLDTQTKTVDPKLLDIAKRAADDAAVYYADYECCDYAYRRAYKAAVQITGVADPAAIRSAARAAYGAAVMDYEDALKYPDPIDQETFLDIADSHDYFYHDVTTDATGDHSDTSVSQTDVTNSCDGDKVITVPPSTFSITDSITHASKTSDDQDADSSNIPREHQASANDNGNIELNYADAPNSHNALVDSQSNTTENGAIAPKDAYQVEETHLNNNIPNSSTCISRDKIDSWSGNEIDAAANCPLSDNDDF